MEEFIEKRETSEMQMSTAREPQQSDHQMVINWKEIGKRSEQSKQKFKKPKNKVWKKETNKYDIQGDDYKIK